MHINILFGAHPVDTEKWHCQENFEAHIDGVRDCFSVTRKKSQRLKSCEYGGFESNITVSVSKKY